MAYGFLRTFAATVAAWVLETLLGTTPPYPLLSVPVLSGPHGGRADFAGLGALLILMVPACSCW